MGGSITARSAVPQWAVPSAMLLSHDWLAPFRVASAFSGFSCGSYRMTRLGWYNGDVLLVRCVESVPDAARAQHVPEPWDPEIGARCA
jgi:hypothetical protein